MRFLDFDPKQMRQPSVPGEKTISENGDNLSSVLRTIKDESRLEESMVSWIRSLTPMDVRHVEFDDFPDGRTLAVLVEDETRRVTLASASDGTVRFLGILAALFSPEPPALLCFEEVETGFHPVRLALVLGLLEARTKRQPLQVLATTHSPQLLRFLQRDHLDSVYVAYRVEGIVQTRLKKLKDLPNFMDVLKDLDAARMLESDWIESTLFFEEGKPAPIGLESGEPEEAPE
jgi:predicted ATPase